MEPTSRDSPDKLGGLGDGLELAALTCCGQYSSLALCTQIDFKYSMLAGEALNVEPSLGQDVLPVFDAAR